ncbi:hypothetical protein L0222_15240, partial [bacterium]|nr:hypothetical protein [bacterium]
GGSPEQNSAITTNLDGKKYIFCSEPCLWIFHMEPERKPEFDQFLMTGLYRAAEEVKDDGLARIFASLEEDSVWHREWSSSLVQYVLNQNRNCETSLFAWIDKWYPQMLHAIVVLLNTCNASLPDRNRPDLEQVEMCCRNLWDRAGLRRN